MNKLKALGLVGVGVLAGVAFVVARGGDDTNATVAKATAGDVVSDCKQWEVIQLQERFMRTNLLCGGTSVYPKHVGAPYLNNPEQAVEFNAALRASCGKKSERTLDVLDVPEGWLPFAAGTTPSSVGRQDLIWVRRCKPSE